MKQIAAARLKLVLVPVLVMWALETIDWILPGRPLDGFGIRPREFSSLPWILTAPWLHFGFGHLMANTVPLAIMALFIVGRGADELLEATLGSVLVGGLGVWLVGGGNSIHLGASILVFGYFGFLVARGVATRHPLDVVVALLVVVLYSGAILGGIVPGRDGISWEGHLFGLIGGALGGGLGRRRNS